MLSYAAKAIQVRAALRKLRAVYRGADSQGEVLERELDRLINRKTLVETQSLSKSRTLLAEYIRRINLLPQAFDDTVRISAT
jgi:hypothetical protein